jgi:hypothetical protein
MSKTTIRFGLSKSEIDRAIREVNEFKKEFQRKVDLCRQRIAEEIAKEASLNFGSAIVDDVINGSPRKPDVKVSFSDDGKISVVVADGKDAVWCEFGAGVYHNGAVGSSPNPYGNDLGFTIGSYGEGHGKQQAWGYYTDPDNKEGLVITRGTPASMPMYNAAQEVMRKSIQIAREVFGQ